MIHRNIVERVVCQGKIFLWGDETEYYYRITKKNKIPVLYLLLVSAFIIIQQQLFHLRKDWDYRNAWKM